MKDITLFPTHLRKIKSGVDQLANAVKVTLGPSGSPVILEQKDGTFLITKDGVSVAKEIDLQDPIENMGAQLVKEVANNVAKLAGDGTTNSVVLSQAIFNAGIKNVAAGASPLNLKRGIDRAVTEVVKQLKLQSKPVTSSLEIAQVGAISANNDMEIGQMIADAMDKVGKDGVITVDEARGTETYVTVTEGMEFNQGYLSRHFINNTETFTVEYENAKLLFYKQKLDSIDKIMPIVEQCIRENVALVIIAEEVEGACLNTLILNKVRGNRKLCAVRAPYFSERRADNLEDMAVLTGGIVIDEDTGMRLDQLTLADLGTCEKIVINQDNTLILGGKGDLNKIARRAKEIENNIESAYSTYDREKYQERLARLTGGVAVLYIGGTTESEMKEKKDRVDDALHATRAAVQEGTVIGGGNALLYSYFAIQHAISTGTLSIEPRELEGFNIILEAISMPFKTILANAGIDYQIPMQTLKNHYLDVIKDGNTTFDCTLGYNVDTNELVSMIDNGIIDPTKVPRLALENAASIASLLLTSKGTINFTRFNQPSVIRKKNDYLSIDDLD